MIAVAVAVIAGVVAVTCGIVADSNHSDSLAFLGVMVKTTAAQIFLTGAICTWTLFAALWLLSVGIRRSKQRTLELRALRGGPAYGDTEVFDTAAPADGGIAAGGHAYGSYGGLTHSVGTHNGFGIARPAGAGAAAPAPARPPALGIRPAPAMPPPIVAMTAMGEEPTLTEDAFADDF